MLISKLDKVLSETSSVTGYPPEIVGSVVSHTFNYIASFVKKPTAAGIRLLHFGVIRGSLAALNYYIYKFGIPRIRKERTESAVEDLRVLWRFRQMLMKDNERRNFNKRFNKQWHWKKS